jgi:hypothetical protein
MTAAVSPANPATDHRTPTDFYLQTAAIGLI